MSNASNYSFFKKYKVESRRPIYSAILVLPFLTFYHLFLFILQPNEINGGHMLIQQMLRPLLGSAMLGPAFLMLLLFVIWQIRTKNSWSYDRSVALLGFAESLFFAIVLLFLMGWVANNLHLNQIETMSTGRSRSLLLDLTLYCGAGVYEELVFRVFLIGLLVLVFEKLFYLEKTQAIGWAVFLGAILFSLFHYFPGGDPFQLNSFLQRTFAGIYFAALLTLRNFGVAAATHALYDIMVGGLHRLAPG